MKKILILFAHPALQNSRVNSALITGINEISNVTFHDLYQAYPEFDIDVIKEQKLLLEHEVVIFHYPFFWYSAPSILKEWQDLVLEHGWAYGRDGNALSGKLFLNIITTGGRKSAYNSSGYNNFSMRQLLAPLEQTANLCKMQFLPPYIIHGTHSITNDEIVQHRSNYFSILKAIINDEINWDRLKTAEYFNNYIK